MSGVSLAGGKVWQEQEPTIGDQGHQLADLAAVRSSSTPSYLPPLAEYSPALGKHKQLQGEESQQRGEAQLGCRGGWRPGWPGSNLSPFPGSSWSQLL